MPQMAPLYWMILFLLFLSLFMLSSLKIYFTQNLITLPPNINYSLNQLHPTLLNWKW